MNRRGVTLARWAIVLALPFFLVLTVVRSFMGDWFVRLEYSRPDFPPAFTFSPEARFHFATESIRYIRGDTSLQQFRDLGVYNEREISHMVDVQRVTVAALAVQILSGLTLLVALVYLLWRPFSRTWAYAGLVSGAILTVVLLGLIGVFSVTAFDTFFVLFHRIFFTGDTWLFLPTDSLIQFYPEMFWQDIAVGIVGLTILAAAVTGGVGYALQRRSLGSLAPAVAPGREQG